MTSKFCHACGAEIDSRAEICMKCGVRQPGTSGSRAAVSSKNRTTAGILAIFLGWIGIHKFYLGDSGLGIVFLIFSFTGIPCFISIIEGIMFLTMSDEAFAQKYR